MSANKKDRESPSRINDFVIKVANVNGSGSASANSLLYKSIFRMGIPVSAKNIFPSNIQGLPTWYEIRINGEGHTGRSPQVDFMIAMNPQTIADDIEAVAAGGYLLYDSTWPLADDIKRDDITFLSVPLTALSVEAFPDVKTRILMKNITYVGATAAFLGIDREVITQLLRETYAKKPHLSQANMLAVELSYKHVHEAFSCPLPIRVEEMNKTKDEILITGNAACALGCLYAGATVAAWYPITPATSLADAFTKLCMRYRRDPDTGKIMACIVQAEDELSAVGMAIGAGWAGARSFTSTSGPGLSLMSEFLGFAYYTEIPLVVFNVQRAGPSTGLPTRTQQADILACAYASHGDTKHILLFPANPGECFYLSVQAFDLAERFQTPVMVLSDLDIGMNEWMTGRLQWDDNYKPDRGKVLSAAELKNMEHFYRYLDSDGDGIPHRTLPGVHPGGAYFLRGSGHNEDGRYSEKPEDYVRNVDRLRRKLQNASRMVPAPVIETHAGSRLGIVSIGSCDLALREALTSLAKEKMFFDYMRIMSFPFSERVEKFLEDHEHCFVVEQNRDGQLRSLLILETGIEKDKLSSVLSYGGLPIDSISIVDKIRLELNRRKGHELQIKAQGSSPQ
jgi:2-oxoglutarate ferredoxin oxidoreductase subunit alpha